MKWLTIAAVAMALLIGCAYVMVNKQEEIKNLVGTVQKYIARRDALKEEIDKLEDERDKWDALRREWIEHRKRAGELISIYGSKTELESACKALTKKRDKLMALIAAYSNEVATLEGHASQLEIQTNALARAMRKFAGERDLYMEQSGEAKREYDKQKSRAEEETKRADEAAAKAAKNRKIAEEYQAKVDVASADAEVQVKIHTKRGQDVKKNADLETSKLAKVQGEVATAQIKAKALADEVAALEARKHELGGVEKTLAAKKAELTEIEAKIVQVHAKASAQQIASQVDAVREDVAKKLGTFENKLKELDRKNAALEAKNAEADKQND